MINQLITSGKFHEAFDLIKGRNITSVAEELKDEAIGSEDISYYAFINYLNKDGDNAELHFICSLIASVGINHYKGGYATAFYHITRAIELEPNNTSYKQYALLFNDIPDKLLSDALAKKYKVLSTNQNGRN